MAKKIKCIRCGKSLPESEFYPSCLKRYCYLCKKCHYKKTSKYIMAYQKRRKGQEIANINPNDYIGGLSIRVLNYAKKNECKFSIESTDGISFKTSDKKEFMRELSLLIN